MADTPSFLGCGFAFPPSFAGGRANMTEAEADIEASLRILFGTRPGERFLHPEYGLDLHDWLFEPLSTTARTFLKDRITTTVLLYEPRIRVLDLAVDDSALNEGLLRIRLDYRIASTNSRFNLVFPYYRVDANEVHPSSSIAASGQRHGRV